MPVVVLRAELLTPQARSLKEKRSPISSLKARLRNRVGASVAEVAHQELLGRAAIEVAIAASDAGALRGLAEKAERLIRGARDAELLRLSAEFVELSDGGGGEACWP